jgi:hypothetical protein
MHRLAWHRRTRPAALGLVAALAPLVLPGPALAQDGHVAGHALPSPVAMAAPRASAITLDGRLEEAAWDAGTVVGDFTQTQPHEGQPATQRTEVRFLYDADALYIGARMYDTDGAAGVRTRLARRDNLPDADYIEIIFDTFHDHLGRVSFMVNPSGVKGDSYGPNGAGLDDSWDAVWDVATRVDSLGWTAEFRIPFAQLRYPRDSVQTWGLQVLRNESRLNELSMWSFWRQNEAGGPPRFGHLEDLRIARGPGRAEILPYAVARSTRQPLFDRADPFTKATAYDARVGADVKYLLASNLTLSATVNPDFGQVEVDPAVVNLSAFETFFPEHRPFFVEGGGLFSFGGLNCFFCSNVSNPNLFYSRRIGRQPQGAGNAYAAGAYADVPENTRILGAAKVTGSVAPGWTLATLDALTAREAAAVDDGAGVRSRVQVEPFTNYFVGRISRDLAHGSFLRGMVTSVVRDLRDSTLRTQLTSHAEAAGVQTDVWWGGRTYRWMGFADISQVSGDPAAILRLQRSSARYFQRPDRALHGNGLFTDRFDSTLTTMRGYALHSRFSKDAGDWLWEAQGMVKSPGFESNDVGFSSQADRIWLSGNVVRSVTKPNRFARQMWFSFGGQTGYNYSGDRIDGQVNSFAQVMFLNYWNVTAMNIVRPRRMDDQLTRGGPVVERPASVFWDFQVQTDTRKPLMFAVEPSVSASEGFHSRGLSTSVTVRPASTVSLSLGPSWEDDRIRSQYVTTVADPTATAMYGNRYLFAFLRQKTLSMETRLSLTFSPTLTLEMYVQPLIASGAYSAFHEFDRPRSLARSTFGVDRGTVTRSGTDYVIDPDGPAGPAAPITLPDPDFNFRSLRGNAVVRWEFHPGSTLYLVWTQSRSDDAGIGDFRLGRDLRGLVATRPENIFLVKVSYWMGL